MSTGRGERPLILLDGSVRLAEVTIDDLTSENWEVRRGWEAPSPRFDVRASRVVCVGEVESASDAASAVLAAARGAGVVVTAVADDSLRASLHEDLSRIGQIEHRDESWLTPSDLLEEEEIRLLEVLGQGVGIEEAGRVLGYSRRTVNRRLANIRETLGAATTAEALMTFGDSPNRD